MKGYARKFNDMKLRNKMVWSYMLFFILPFIIVGLFVVQEFRQTALTRATEQAESTVQRVKSRVQEMLGVPVLLANQLSLDTDLEDVATTRYQDVFQVVDAYWSYTKFKVFLDFNSEITRVKVYADNPTLIDNWEFTPLDAKTEQSFWYQSAIGQTGRLGWYYFPSDSRSSSSMLSLVRSVYFQKTRAVGLLQVDVNTNELNAILAQEEPDIVLTDERGVVVASNRSALMGKKLDEQEWGERLSGLEPGKHELAVGGISSQVIVDALKPENSYNELNIVYVFPLESIMKEANRISVVGFQIISVVFVVALVLIYSICTVLTNRLLKFSKQINKVSMGNFNTELAVDGSDEIGQIKRQFNQMVGSIRELMDEVQASHEQKRQLESKQNEIKLKMLASQINPHFLYNALESIRMMADMEEKEEISEAIYSLGKMMRYSMKWKTQQVSLTEEAAMAGTYVRLMNIVSDVQVELEMHIDSALAACPIPKMSLEPLVENAVVHGIEPTGRNGVVSVAASYSGQFLVVEVTDDGVGMERDRVELINRALEEDNEPIGLTRGNGIGLLNVHKRIRLFCGKPYGIRIESEPGRYTRVVMRLPYQNQIGGW